MSLCIVVPARGDDFAAAVRSLPDRNLGPSTPAVLLFRRQRQVGAMHHHLIRPRVRSDVVDDEPANNLPDWQPATSRPGEVFTPEGQIAGMGVFARGLKNRRRRSSRSRRSMTTIVYACLAVCAAVVAFVLLTG